MSLSATNSTFFHYNFAVENTKYIKMTESINILNFDDTLYFSRIEHDSYCENRLAGHGLMWVRSGKLVIESPKGTVTAHPGQFIFWQRDCTSSMNKLSAGDEPFSSIAISINKSYLKEFFHKNVSCGKLREKIKPIGGKAVLLPQTITLQSLFYSLVPYAENGIEPNRDTIEAKVTEAISLLLKIDDRFYPTLFDFHETWKIDLYEFMKAHFTEDMTINEFAHYSGRSLATFKRDFAKISNETPQKWLIRERLKFSARLLVDENMKPADAYLRVGFKNKPHFFKVFKDQFGCTPTEYKNKYIYKQNDK